MTETFPSRYVVRIVASGNGTRYELFDTEGRRSVKAFRSLALAVSDMSFLNSLLAADTKSGRPEGSLTLLENPSDKNSSTDAGQPPGLALQHRTRARVTRRQARR